MCTINRFNPIPVFRIFDEGKAREFYVDWLGFTVDWEHRFEPDLPLYMQISREGLTLHLTEHHGDATPGSKIFVWMNDIRGYHTELTEQNYSNNRPGLEEAFWGGLSFEVIDPFGNRIIFSEEGNGNDDVPDHEARGEAISA